MSDQQDDSSDTEIELRDQLGAESWHSRKAVVRRLWRELNGPAAEKLLQIVRDEHRDLARVNAAIEVLAHTPSNVVPGLLELLNHSDADVRCYVALTLGERGDPQAIPAIVELLSDDSANVCSHAIEALGKLRAAAAVDRLIAFVEDLNFELAFPALDALKAIGDRRIAHRLLPLLNHSLYKLAAIEAIGELGDEEVIRPLLDRFQDPDVPPSAIGLALARMHERHEEVYGACDFIPDLVRGMTDSSGVQSFLSTVSNDVLDARLITVLSWLPGEEVHWTLASLLERFPFEERVIQAVAKRGSAIAPLLAARLAGASLDVRRAIIEVLLRVADRKSSPALLQVVDSDADELSTARALEALTRLSEPRLYEAALKHFGHSSPRIRQAAVAAFGCAASESAISDLQTLWSSSSSLVRESVLRAAAYLGDSQVIGIVVTGCGDADEHVRSTAIEQLATIDDERAAELLKDAIQAENALIRTAAVTALPKTGLDAAIAESLLQAVLDDSDIWVRYFAIRALVALHLASQHLPKLVAMAQTDAGMQVRIAAIEALGHSDEKAFTVLQGLTTSTVEELAQAALLALARTNHPQTLATLKDWLTSSSESKRRKAVQALAVPTLEAVEILQAIALGADHRLAMDAVASLGRIPTSPAAAALVETLAWPQRRDAAIKALVGLSMISLPALQAALAHSSLDVRRAAIEALARIRTPAAIDVLEAALHDRAAAVRHAALTALAHLRAKKAAGDSGHARGGRP